MDFPRTIYAIQHNVTKRIYIGSSCRLKDRYKNHIYALRTGKHSNEDMQSDYDQYGEDYSVFALEEVCKYDDRSKEYEWMKKYKTHQRGIGYNYNDPAFTRSKKPTELPLKEGLPETVEEAAKETP